MSLLWPLYFETFPVLNRGFRLGRFSWNLVLFSGNIVTHLISERNNLLKLTSLASRIRMSVITSVLNFVWLNFKKISWDNFLRFPGLELGRIPGLCSMVNWVRQLCLYFLPCCFRVTGSHWQYSAEEIVQLTNVHGIKKTRYDITHFAESQHGKYGDLKNGWFCKNSSRSQYNFRFGLKNKTHGPMDCFIKNFPKKKLIFKNYFSKKLGYLCNRSYRACILPWILNIKRNKFHVLKPYNL